MKSSANIPVDSDAYAEGAYQAPDGIIVENFKHCPRCGGEHMILFFQPFLKPLDQFTHWTLCPLSKDPILSFGVPEEEEKDG